MGNKPDYTGSTDVDGKQFRAAMWKNKGKDGRKEYFTVELENKSSGKKVRVNLFSQVDTAFVPGDKVEEECVL